MTATRSLDNGAAIYRATKLYSTPEYVKTASHDQIRGDENLGTHIFADPYGRRFPCHNPAAVWASAQTFFEKEANEIGPLRKQIESRIKRAADYFGIAGDIESLRGEMTKAATVDLGQLPDEAFAYVAKYGDKTERRLPLRNGNEVKAAAAWLQEYAREFTYGDRRRIAERVLAKSAEFKTKLDVDADEFLNRTAGNGVCAAKQAADLLDDRALRIVNVDISGELKKIAKQLREKSADTRDPARLTKLASLVDAVDRVTGIANDYARGLDLPEHTLFSITKSATARFLGAHIQLTDGSIFKRADLDNVRVKDIRDCMGDELADALTSDGIHLDIEKAADIVPTLPRAEAEQFTQLLTEKGVAALAKEAGAAQGLTADDIKYFAAMA